MGELSDDDIFRVLQKRFTIHSVILYRQKLILIFNVVRKCHMIIVTRALRVWQILMKNRGYQTKRVLESVFCETWFQLGARLTTTVLKEC